MTLEVNYVGSSSHRLIRSVDGNPPIPALVAAAQANGTLDPTTSGGIANSSSILGSPSDRKHRIRRADRNQNGWERHLQRTQTTFHKRFSHGIDFQAAYTWSHAIDDSNDPLERLAETATLRAIPSICS